MTHKKIYTIEEAESLKINEIQELYKNYINPNQTNIFSSLPFGNEVFESAEGVHFLLLTEKNFRFYRWTRRLGLGHNNPRILEARINFQKRSE